MRHGEAREYLRRTSDRLPPPDLLIIAHHHRRCRQIALSSCQHRLLPPAAFIFDSFWRFIY